MAEQVRVLRDHAVGLLVWMGFTPAEHWDNDRLARKLLSVNHFLPEEDEKPEGEELNDALIKILAGIESNCEFEVYDGSESVEEPEPEKEEEKEPEKEVDPEPEQEESDDAEEEPEPEPETEESEEVAEQEPDENVAAETDSEEVSDTKEEPVEDAVAEKEPEKKEEKAKKPRKKREKKGFREGSKTRGYYAGIVAKKFGWDNGITDEMINEVDHLYGKANADVSKVALVRAYHVLQGYENGGEYGADKK